MITSASNERLKRLRRLRKRAERSAEGVFLIEGYRQVRRAVDAAVEITELYAAPDLFQGDDEAALADQLAATIVAAPAFATLATRDRPDGLIAVARTPDTSLSRLGDDDLALALVAEGVERPGNLGTMIRTACAAGATAVIAVDPQTDVYAPEVVRASVGTLFAQPLAVAGADEAVAFLRQHQARIVTASPAGDTAVWDADLSADAAPRIAIAVGSEQHGVTPIWFQAADAVVRIPMAGVDSVNVASAAAVLLFEAVRQRRQSQK